LAQVQNIGLPFQDGLFFMNQTQFGSFTFWYSKLNLNHNFDSQN
jgi:hypothetical protein